MSVIKRWNSVTEEWEVAVVGKTGPVGPTGVTGPVGATGATGGGAATGGLQGQVLTKASSTNFDTQWTTATPFRSTTTAFIWPAGVGIGFWSTGAISSNAANSQSAVTEALFDIGSHNAAAVSITFHVETTNDGAGAAMAVALYEPVNQYQRSIILDCGSALIGTTGAKRITFARTLVPRHVAVHFALRNINTAGVNPTFAGVGTTPPTRITATNTIFSGAGNNSPAFIPAGGNTGSWPATSTMNINGSFAIAAILEVQA